MTERFFLDPPRPLRKGEEDPPPTPPQGRGVIFLFIMSSRQSEAMRDLVVVKEEILPSFGRQNDRVLKERDFSRREK